LNIDPAQVRDLPILDWAGLREETERLQDLYRSASPFPHAVLDDFLEQEVANLAITGFPSLDDQPWNSYVHVNEKKFGHTDPSLWGPALRSVLDELNSPHFVQFLRELTGIDGLFADPSLEGGGLHQSTTGGFLNIHADFTVHPHHRDWRRRVNLILYLNDEWQSEYGGNLELWDTDMKRCRVTVEPIGNRAVIFTTDADSFHGHPEPMRCPPGVARRSLALYYFSVDKNSVVRSTEYRARPGDGLRSILIFADKEVLRAYDWIKRRLGISDSTAFKVLSWLGRLGRRSSPRKSINGP